VSRARTPSGSTAETLVLIALVLQIIGGVLVLFGIAWLFGLSLVHPFAGRWVWFALTAAGVVGVLVVVFLYFAYTLCYRRIQRGEYAEAQAPTLVIGILSLFFGLIPGIFYLVGYAKLDSAIREQQGPPPVYGVPTAVPPIACTGCGRVYPVGAYAFCPACGRKLGP
jgi:hypothetical protein